MLLQSIIALSLRMLFSLSFLKFSFFAFLFSLWWLEALSLCAVDHLLFLQLLPLLSSAFVLLILSFGRFILAALVIISTPTRSAIVGPISLHSSTKFAPWKFSLGLGPAWPIVTGVLVLNFRPCWSPLVSI